VFTVKAIFNSLVDRNGGFSFIGEVPFSRRTYSLTIDEDAHRFSSQTEHLVSFQSATTTSVGRIISQTKVMKEKYLSEPFYKINHEFLALTAHPFPTIPDDKKLQENSYISLRSVCLSFSS
jgi:hypothetical protein